MVEQDSKMSANSQELLQCFTFNYYSFLGKEAFCFTPQLFKNARTLNILEPGHHTTSISNVC